MAAYRLYADDRGHTHIEPLDLFAVPFENGPGEFKGVGGSVLGDASRLMLMRFESGSHPDFHRAVPGFVVVLEGEIVIDVPAGDEVALRPGDAMRVETVGRGRWRLGNRGEGNALLGLVQMPPAATSSPSEGDARD